MSDNEKSLEECLTDERAEITGGVDSLMGRLNVEKQAREACNGGPIEKPDYGALFAEKTGLAELADKIPTSWDELKGLASNLFNFEAKEEHRPHTELEEKRALIAKLDDPGARYTLEEYRQLKQFQTLNDPAWGVTSSDKYENSQTLAHIEKNADYYVPELHALIEAQNAEQQLSSTSVDIKTSPL